MLIQITSLTRNGLKDWYLQRVSSLILSVYLLFLLGYIVGHHPLTFEAWYAVFHHTITKAFTVLALLALIIHSWVGVWTILTDYITQKGVRLMLITLMVLSFIAYFVWTIEILWG